METLFFALHLVFTVAREYYFLNYLSYSVDYAENLAIGTRTRDPTYERHTRLNQTCATKNYQTCTTQNFYAVYRAAYLLKDSTRGK